jgi:nucleotide-binding universal stress UspA family protein
VLGARDHSAAAALLGSVSERVARRSRRPVLIVPDEP